MKILKMKLLILLSTVCAKREERSIDALFGAFSGLTDLLFQLPKISIILIIEII